MSTLTRQWRSLTLLLHNVCHILSLLSRRIGIEWHPMGWHSSNKVYEYPGSCKLIFLKYIFFLLWIMVWFGKWVAGYCRLIIRSRLSTLLKMDQELPFCHHLFRCRLFFNGSLIIVKNYYIKIFVYYNIPIQWVTLDINVLSNKFNIKFLFLIQWETAV